MLLLYNLFIENIYIIYHTYIYKLFSIYLFMKMNKIKKRYKIQWGLNRYEVFKLKPNYKAISTGLLISSVGLIIPDLSLSLILGFAVMSPLGFKKGLALKIDRIKEKVFKIKYRYLTRWLKHHTLTDGSLNFILLII